jgi:hypothetical protein
MGFLAKNWFCRNFSSTIKALEKISKSVYMLPLTLCCKRVAFDLKKTLMASFAPLAAGKPGIPNLAPVNEWPWPSPEGTRSVSEALLTGIAREEL